MNRRHFILAILGAFASGKLFGFGKKSYFTCGILKHQGNYKIRNSGLKKMLWEVSKRTSISVSLDLPEIDPEDRKTLFKYPFIYLTGQKQIIFSNNALNNLREYLNMGGFLFVDSAEGVLNGQFHQGVIAFMAGVNRELKPLPRNHVVYKTFNLLEQPYGTVSLDGNFYGSDRGERLDILYSQNDVMGACTTDYLGNWDRSVTSGETQREMAFRTGINVVMYALCLDYKEEQHHIKFLLDRRR